LKLVIPPFTAKAGRRKERKLNLSGDWPYLETIGTRLITDISGIGGVKINLRPWSFCALAVKKMG
jgi:hypothetical protein